MLIVTQHPMPQVVGFIEPLPAKEDGSPATGVEFENHIVGSAIPSNFIPSVEKGFREAATTGAVIGYPMEVSTGYPVSKCCRGWQCWQASVVGRRSVSICVFESACSTEAAILLWLAGATAASAQSDISALVSSDSAYAPARQVTCYCTTDVSAVCLQLVMEPICEPDGARM